MEDIIMELLLGIAALMLLGLLICLFWFLFVGQECEKQVLGIEDFKVIGINYIPHQSHTGTGFSSGGNVVFTTSTTPEKNIVILKQKGNILKIDNEELLNNVEPGLIVKVQKRMANYYIRIVHLKFYKRIQYTHVEIGDKIINILGNIE